jgi:hypothetical protein
MVRTGGQNGHLQKKGNRLDPPRALLEKDGLTGIQMPRGGLQVPPAIQKEKDGPPGIQMPRGGLQVPPAIQKEKDGPPEHHGLMTGRGHPLKKIGTSGGREQKENQASLKMFRIPIGSG